MAKGDSGIGAKPMMGGGVQQASMPMKQMPSGLGNENASPIGMGNKEEVLAKLIAASGGQRPGIGMPMPEPMPMPITGPSGPLERFAGGPMESGQVAGAGGMKSGVGPSNIAALIQALAQRRG